MDSAALGDLRLLANRTLTELSLQQCRGLADAFCKEMQIRTLAGTRRSAFLRSLIVGAVRGERERAINVLRSDMLASGFHAAAAGELLEIAHDDGVFDELLRIRGVLDSYWEQKRIRYKPKQRRQLRAGLWLGYRAEYSYKAAERAEPDLLEALFWAALTYAGQNSLQEIRDYASREVMDDERRTTTDSRTHPLQMPLAFKVHYRILNSVRSLCETLEAAVEERRWNSYHGRRRSGFYASQCDKHFSALYSSWSHHERLLGTIHVLDADVERELEDALAVVFRSLPLPPPFDSRGKRRNVRIPRESDWRKMLLACKCDFLRGSDDACALTHLINACRSYIDLAQKLLARQLFG